VGVQRLAELLDEGGRASDALLVKGNTNLHTWVTF
jgi:hypothetical protein